MKTYKTLLLISSVAGVLFSGYMSSIKFFSDTCAFGETCPLFLGMPACYYGFTMFLLLFIMSLLLAFGKGSPQTLGKSMTVVSLLGIAFAGYFSAGELPTFFERGFKAYVFGLPTCVMGCVFFILVFIICLAFRRKLRKMGQTTIPTAPELSTGV
jgi:hypothetical protein